MSSDAKAGRGRGRGRGAGRGRGKVDSDPVSASALVKLDKAPMTVLESEGSPFDLTNMIDAVPDMQVKKEEDSVFGKLESKMTNLEGFDEVPRANWANIPIGSVIKYQTILGEMKNGGTVQEVDVKPSQVVTFQLTSGRGGRGWYISSSKTKKIWIRSGAGLGTVNVQSNFAPLTSPSNAGLSNDLLALKERVSTLETNMQQVLVKIAAMKDVLQRLAGGQ